MSFNFPVVELSVTTATVWCSFTVSVWFVFYSVLMFLCAVVNLGRGSKGSMESPFGFSFDEKLWKPGLQRSVTI